jgi:broad specificity phosphatase PhoE
LNTSQGRVKRDFDPWSAENGLHKEGRGADVQTTLFLIRSGVTDWDRAHRLPGRRDLSLAETGRAQAETSRHLLATLHIDELLCSPLQRAIETAEVIAAPHGIPVARDTRLTAMHFGRWEGMSRDELAHDERYRAFLDNPLNVQSFDGESLSDVRARVLAAVDQALEDNEIGANIVLVTHASVIRVLLLHFLGMPPTSYHQLHVTPGAATVLRFASDWAPPRLWAINFGERLELLLGAA